ncbi:hypothetical protein GMAR_ORF262 [Golden Marseillevirus]|uniref:hypothetical protein n=1 Tax=Golden Marseillevirus TaxID=1720526 RepID=UPI000877ABCF|nr:hypothetical protein GMAR_ORF262 [Golden Marseillevirus]ALX27636.1 hypothetical protein GMAR_ORF262 [Golden Marseillevirus]
MSLTYKHEFDEGEYEGVFFQYRNGDFVSSFWASNWSIEETKAYFGQLARGERKAIEFETWNGCVEILVKNNKAHFTVSNSMEVKGVVRCLSLFLLQCASLHLFLFHNEVVISDMYCFLCTKNNGYLAFDKIILYFIHISDSKCSSALFAASPPGAYASASEVCNLSFSSSSNLVFSLNLFISKAGKNWRNSVRNSCSPKKSLSNSWS